MSILGKEPVEIFDYSDLEKSYKGLVKKYHPDTGGNGDEFLFLQKSYELTKRELRLGYAVSSKAIQFRLPDCKMLFPFNSYTDFSYGRVYVCDAYLLYEFSGDSMAADIRNTFTAFTYADDKMREKFNFRGRNRMRGNAAVSDSQNTKTLFVNNAAPIIIIQQPDYQVDIYAFADGGDVHYVSVIIAGGSITASVSGRLTKTIQSKNLNTLINGGSGNN
jgi:hypothetical protein